MSAQRVVDRDALENVAAAGIDQHRDVAAAPTRQRLDDAARREKVVAPIVGAAGAEEAGQVGEKAFLRPASRHLLAQCAEVDQRQVAVQFAHGLPNLGDQRCWLAGRTHRETGASRRGLKIRQINSGRHLTAQLEILRIFGYTDDFNLPAGFGAAQTEALADRIFIAEVPACQGLIDHCDLRRPFIISGA